MLRDFPACSLGWFLPWRWERLLCALCLDQHPKSSSSPAAGKQRQSPCPRLRVGTALSPARAAAAAGGSHISCSFGLFMFSLLNLERCSRLLGGRQLQLLPGLLLCSLGPTRGVTALLCSTRGTHRAPGYPMGFLQA